MPLQLFQVFGKTIERNAVQQPANTEWSRRANGPVRSCRRGARLIRRVRLPIGVTIYGYRETRRECSVCCDVPRRFLWKQSRRTNRGEVHAAIGRDLRTEIRRGQSRSLIARLNDAKVPAQLVVREGAGHAYPGWEADTRLIADWFDEHLRRVR